jgi:hypothetical protein
MAHERDQLQQQCLLRNRGDVLEHQKLLIVNAWRKGFFTYDGTAREAGGAGTHATRLDRVSPYRGFRKLLPPGRG